MMDDGDCGGVSSVAGVRCGAGSLAGLGKIIRGFWLICC